MGKSVSPRDEEASERVGALEAVPGELALQRVETPAAPVRGLTTEGHPDFRAGTAAPAAMPDEEFEVRLIAMRRGRERITRIHRELMDPDTDYGVIPGTKQPTLLEPGAEKLCDFFRLAAQFHPEISYGDGVHSPPITAVTECRLHLGTRCVQAGEGHVDGWEGTRREPAEVGQVSTPRREGINGKRARDGTASGWNGTMVQLQDRIKNGLDEARMLILGAQVLLGFQYRSAFERAFERLPIETQYLNVAGLGLTLVAVGLLMAPAAYHHITDRGESTPDLPPFISQVMAAALLPFALGLGIDCFWTTEMLFGLTPGVVAGLAALLAALFFWYLLGFAHRSEHPLQKSTGREGDRSGREGAFMRRTEKSKDQGRAGLKEKIDHALTEARVVLPGAQALLGFQLSAMLIEGFEKLPASSKYLHLASLALIALSTILLMTPAAYHRIGEQGEYTEHFYRFTSYCLLAAMVPLALGITGDFYVVVRKVCHSAPLSLGLSVLMLLFFFGLWFGLTLYHRTRHHRRAALLKPRTAG